jgi:hypothetical protein
LAELAYILHYGARRLRETITEINITAAYRIQIERHARWMTLQAQSLGNELDAPNPSAFTSKESAESICEQLGVF